MTWKSKTFCQWTPSWASGHSVPPGWSLAAVLAMVLGPAVRSKALERSRHGLKLLGEVELPSPWQKEGWCLYRFTGRSVGRSVKVAAFDFDKTLYFGGSSWKLSSARIPQQLQALEESGYMLAVFSNQQGPGRQRSSENMFLEVQKLLQTFEDFHDFAGVDLQMFISTARGDIDDPYRKPNIGMWDLLLSFLPIDVSQSFYVGNSAGRKNDQNDVDAEFARRVGLRFYTEEFLEQGKSCFPSLCSHALLAISWILKLILTLDNTGYFWRGNIWHRCEVYQSTFPLIWTEEPTYTYRPYI